mgnify:CR=1 FL=1
MKTRTQPLRRIAALLGATVTAIWIAVVGNGSLALAKGTVAWLSGSTALLATAVDSGTDVAYTLFMAWGLWRMLSWARRGIFVALPVYLLLVLGQQAIFVRGDYERGRLPFLAGLSVFSTALVAFILSRRRIRQAFERHDHPPNRTTE